MSGMPESMRSKMPLEDRQPFGKAGMTAAEGESKSKAKNEKLFQEQIYTYLTAHAGVHWVFHARMDRATTNPVGTPDFLFCYHGKFVAIEAKQPGTHPTKEQIEVMKAIEADEGRVTVVRSLHEVVEFLKDIGFNKDKTGWKYAVVKP